MTTILITGGSGFVGRNLIRALRARGDEVRALARSDAATAAVSVAGATPVRGDLDDLAAIREGMRGCDLVIHAAALMTEWGPREQFERANVVGTHNVLSAARDAGVPRLLYLSTDAVLGDGTPLSRVDETRPPSKHPYPRYCATKAAAEAMVLSANGPAFTTVAVRPPVIWGAGDTSLLPQLVDAVKDGRFMWIGGGRYLTSTCHVANVVDGMLRAADSGRGGEVYFLSDGEPVVFRDFMSRLLATQGVKVEVKSVPVGFARAAAWVAETLWERLRLPGKPPITRMGLCMFGQEVTVVDAKARQELGYVGPKSVEEGLRELQIRRL